MVVFMESTLLHANGYSKPSELPLTGDAGVPGQADTVRTLSRQAFGELHWRSRLMVATVRS